MPNHFDSVAHTWDENPDRMQRLYVLVAEIKSLIQEKKYSSAFEYGCGTGNLSLMLKDRFTNITMADSSKGMLDVLQEKLNKENVLHLNPLFLDLEKESYAGSFDLIYTFMTLHHVKNLELVLQRFYEMLNTQGMLIIADLDKEDGSFHANQDEGYVHYGFKKTVMEQLLLNHGFKPDYYHIFYHIIKEREEVAKEYPVFIMSALKQS
jgi:ubiquinone/menaquinone biosynthesis C-methylase UbiE